METKPKNREWVKNAAIIFLAVLLVLTRFVKPVKKLHPVFFILASAIAGILFHF